MKPCYMHRATRSIADVCAFADGRTFMTRINVPREHRGQGHARRLLRQVLADADAEGVTLHVEISPSDGLGYAALKEWYERRGFRQYGHCWRRLPR